MHCPSLTIFGAFFPSWLLCAIVGVVVAVAAYIVLSRMRLAGEMHVIDEKSSFYGLDAEGIAKAEVELKVSLTAIDEVTKAPSISSTSTSTRRSSSGTASPRRRGRCPMAT